MKIGAITRKRFRAALIRASIVDRSVACDARTRVSSAHGRTRVVFVVVVIRGVRGVARADRARERGGEGRG